MIRETKETSNDYWSNWPLLPVPNPSTLYGTNGLASCFFIITYVPQDPDLET